ncbi:MULTISPECIES: 23S rRNA (cytidine(2498)-2'-O)-methyltransferase RlmM [unclassified Halomonas]|uniref:23S rRNA (cytidine(2498)-2'-O)-methyltransferase RlmM n=1 Tax=unclassified Halomonas TaxID=2609666 RepID=UPI00207670A5|nr:23S rRNA (cytidine(2498)-2'-O)-methyltransferase RlmM [Halomonas sp. S3-1-8]
MSEIAPATWLVYCRPGFEPDALAEMQHHAALACVPCVPALGEGWVSLTRTDDEPINALHRDARFDKLIFARQSLAALAALSLSKEDRLTPILEQIKSSRWSFEEIWHETPDTNDGKALAGLIKALTKPLESLLTKRGALRRKAGGRRLHVFWTGGDRVQLAISFPSNRSELKNGIRRLRFPSRAPSRSTLKLEEAWHEFVPREEWNTRLAEHMQAADLGAAPGGWTWQLVQRGMYVYAIDNGPMDKALMKTGQVDHLKEDGFVWAPDQRLDWLVCDIVDKPVRVLTMVERWLTRQWCREAIFNLKLPMKKRWDEVTRCLATLEESLKEAGVGAEIRCRHLYHDREEVTVHVRLTN